MNTESLLLAQDAEAHFGELPANPQALEEPELSRRGRIRRGRDRRRGGPHGNRSPMRPPPLEPSAGLPLRGELDRAGGDRGGTSSRRPGSRVSPRAASRSSRPRPESQSFRQSPRSRGDRKSVV